VTISELLAAAGALIAFHGAIVIPLTFAVWRLGTKVERHALIIEREVIPTVSEIKNRVESIEQRTHKLELTAMRAMGA
jgi:hypothetical protein